MKTHDEYLEEFKTFAKEKAKSLKPTGDSMFNKKSVHWLKSYIDNASDKLPVLNEVLTNRANEILKEAEDFEQAEFDKLKESLQVTGRKIFNKYVKKHLPDMKL